MNDNTLSRSNDIFNRYSVADRDEIRDTLAELQRRYGLTAADVQAFLNAQEQGIPVSVFAAHGVLEGTAQYLLEHGTSARDAARLLARSETTVRNSCSKARAKGPLRIDETAARIPLAVLAERAKSPLYAVTAYLHERLGWRFADIARALGRDPRNINTTYRRYKR